MKDEFLSVGIDVGTTTTQIIFSRLTMENSSGGFAIQDFKIIEKEIIYKSPIYFTPILLNNEIDINQLKKILEEQYIESKIDSIEVSTGAIIITGETARKENAERVLHGLSKFAGDFVVATAGPDLEAVLAGYGAGAAEYSKEHNGYIINYDIGGGTTNVAVFFDGEVVDSFALDIGGRLIKVDENGIVTYVAHKMKHIIRELDLKIIVGEKAMFCELNELCKRLSTMVLEIFQGQELRWDLRELFIGHKNKNIEFNEVMFSGGVAEFIYSDKEINTIEEATKFNDIGPLLGFNIRNAFNKYKSRMIESKEKIRATVIGAGNYSVKLSGSTIVYDEEILPLKNIPVIKLFENESENIALIKEQILNKINIYADGIIAVAFKGPKSPKYTDVKSMALQIIECFQDKHQPIIVIVENDFAKALGQTIKNNLREHRNVICIDKINVNMGNYIDIGRCISGVIPVMVKTLIFS